MLAVRVIAIRLVGICATVAVGLLDPATVIRLPVRRFLVLRFPVLRFPVRRFLVRRFPVRRFPVLRFLVLRFLVPGVRVVLTRVIGRGVGVARVGWHWLAIARGRHEVVVLTVVGLPV